jgi:cellulose synthase/poly-beta-1,6-N-acetylglucosamine synthase-like glycosyltransferase
LPAHNEELVIAKTLDSVLRQAGEGDRVIVVADNCSDRTAQIAQQAGATVIERRDEQRRGKGYAVDFGVRTLEADPPEVVIMVDADCRVHEGAIDVLSRSACATGRPCQAIYTMDLPPDPSAQDRISAFAFRVKNLARPMGAARFGMPCLLTGTGMAFPWNVICGAPLASGNIVEDMQLGIDLAIAGQPPLLCPDARVTGQLPQRSDAAVSQRTRWEHGHLQTIKTQAPRLLKEAIASLRPALLAMVLDLSVPPLSFLVLIWLAVTALVLAGASVGLLWFAIAPVAAGWVLLLLAILAGWLKCGREVLPATQLAAIPLYVLRKLPLYLAFWRKRQLAWVRTERDAVSGKADSTAGPQPPGSVDTVH